MASSHILMVVWGTVEVIMFGGIIFGWTSLVFIFKKEGYFDDLCEYNTTTGNQTLSNEVSYCACCLFFFISLFFKYTNRKKERNIHFTQQYSTIAKGKIKTTLLQKIKKSNTVLQ